MDCNVDSTRLSQPTDWCAVFTKPRHEKRVSEHFRVREIENFLPLYQAKRTWSNGSTQILQLPLFSGYIFVRIATGERTSVLEVPGVIRLVGGRREAYYISDAYISSLRGGLQEGIVEPHPYLTVGAKVRIRTGVMAGLEGVLKRKKGNVRVVLSLAMIMQSISVDVALQDIEPIGLGSVNDRRQIRGDAA